MGIYLDYNASTPIHKDVLDAMIAAYKSDYGNADSRTHNFGEQARRAVENARHQIANLLHVSTSEVFFTSGATESDNIALLGLREYAEKTGKNHIITTQIEHKAVLQPLKQLENNGFEVTYIAPNKCGFVEVCEVIHAIKETTLLVSIMHANNETGIIQPVDEIGDYLEDKDIFFHIDAAQSFGKLVPELQRIKYDILSASAHKMYGPQGVGALVLKKKHYRFPPVHSIMFGGNQEHGLRPGTLPTALIVGFGKAAQLALDNYTKYLDAYKNTKTTISTMISESGVRFEVNGNQDFCMPNTLNISFPGVNSEALMLASREFCGISNGSACNSSSYKPSYVLSAMGYDIGRIQSSVRLSWGYDSFKENEFISLLSVVKSLQ